MQVVVKTEGSNDALSYCRFYSARWLMGMGTSAEELNQAFPEIASVSRDCKFRTCTHTHEPSCAVKPAVEEGIIANFRFDNYLQFLSEIENRRETYKKVSKKIPK